MTVATLRTKATLEASLARANAVERAYKSFADRLEMESWRGHAAASLVEIMDTERNILRTRIANAEKEHAHLQHMIETTTRFPDEDAE